MTTPQPQVRKICTVCKADVSQTKRIKDDQGRYYCPPCWQKQQKSSPTQNPLGAGAKADPAIDNYALAALSELESESLAAMKRSPATPATPMPATAPRPQTDTPFRTTASIPSLTQQQNEAAEPAGTKPCPFCAETIKAAAIKCRYCGMMLEVQSSEVNDNYGMASATPPGTAANQSSMTTPLDVTGRVNTSQFGWGHNQPVITSPIYFI